MGFFESFLKKKSVDLVEGREGQTDMKEPIVDAENDELDDGDKGGWNNRLPGREEAMFKRENR